MKPSDGLDMPLLRIRRKPKISSYVEKSDPPHNANFRITSKCEKIQKKSAKDRFPKSTKKVCKMYELKIEQNQSAQKVHEKYKKFKSTQKVYKKCKTSTKCINIEHLGGRSPPHDSAINIHFVLF